MYDLISVVWLVIGGLLEPVWLLSLKKSENFTNPFYSLMTAIFIFVSPFCLAISMNGIPVGIAYSVWTGIGAVCAVWLGALLFKEEVSKKTAFYVALIIIGASGLALAGGSA